MDKHTPGPWKHIPWHVAEGYAQVRAPEGWLICETSSEANARLIAAAPDLLKALDELLQYSRLVSGNFYAGDPMRKKWSDSCDAARAAIARAKAEQKQ